MRCYAVSADNITFRNHRRINRVIAYLLGRGGVGQELDHAIIIRVKHGIIGIPLHPFHFHRVRQGFQRQKDLVFHRLHAVRRNLRFVLCGVKHVHHDNRGHVVQRERRVNLHAQRVFLPIVRIPQETHGFFVVIRHNDFVGLPAHHMHGGRAHREMHAGSHFNRRGNACFQLRCVYAVC